MYLFADLLIYFVEQGKGDNSAVPSTQHETRTESWTQKPMAGKTLGTAQDWEGLLASRAVPRGLEKPPLDALAKAAPAGLSGTHDTQK